MNPRTEFSPMFLRWIISLTIATLLIAFFWQSGPKHSMTAFSPIPWVTAGGLVIEQGLDEFRGGQPAPVSGEARWVMIAGLLVFLVAPAVLFFSWRALSMKTEHSGLRPATIAFGIGVVLMFMSALAVGMGAIAHPFVAKRMHEAQALGEDRDQAIRGLWRISIDAYQYKLLPKNLGGGGGSYLGYEVPESLRNFESREYTAVSVGDTTFTILGSSVQYPGAGVQGVYDRQGRLSGHFKFMGSYQ